MLTALLRYDPLVQIEIGPLVITPHGIMTAVGIYVAMQVIRPAGEKIGITMDWLYGLMARAVLGAIIGARIAFVVGHLDIYIDDPLSALKAWEGGLSLLGGIIGAVLICLPKVRSEGLSFFKLADAIVPGMAIGISVGRIGDLIIADHLGKPTNFVLGYACPGVTTGSPCNAAVGQGVHQTALYDLVATAVLFVILITLRRKMVTNPRKVGYLTLVFGAGYGFTRFIEGFFRLELTHGSGLNGSQWTALATITVCLVLLATRWRNPTTPTTATSEVGAEETLILSSGPQEGPN
ncbi:MAG: prolipoprotein diacylglyceryl transferase [Acidimicrobiales bacterium]